MEKNEMNEQMQVRLEKANALRESGINPFANGYKPENVANEIITEFDQFDKEQLDEQKNVVTIAGRIMTKRGQGKAGFANLKDNSGEIQIYANKGNLSEEDFVVWKQLDLGDIVYVSGEVFKTKVGAMAIRALELRILTKAIRPLPDKHHGLTDIEERYRRRYVDLIVNDESKNTLVARSKIIAGIREYLNGHDYLEVETPVLQTIAGGAAAKPFITHHNTLDMDMYLRIAPELYLKRLVVGGIPRVYEIGKLFRNEGMSIKHNPEFTSIEIYAMFEDMQGMMNLTEDIIQDACMRVNNTLEIQYEDYELNLGKFERIHMVDLIKEHTGVNFFEINDLDVAMQVAKEHNIDVEKHHSTVGHIINEFFEQVCEEKLIQPTFVYGHPKEISPLSRPNEADPRFTDRFELFIGGREYANAFSELNDPIDQKERFEGQVKERELGNDEATEIDHDFIEALEYGMAPTGGLGIGIDRLVMLLTNSSSIRDVIFFPTMKHKK